MRCKSHNKTPDQKETTGMDATLAPTALHIHHREDEAFWLLEGRLTVRCGDSTFTAEPGSFTLLPRGVPHTFLVEGDTPARLLSICTPGGFERYFAAAGRPAEHDG